MPGMGKPTNDPEDDLIWWAKGGRLYGDAWPRLAFLRRLLEEDVKTGLTTMGGTTSFPWSRVSGATDGAVRFIYLGEHQPQRWTVGLPMDDGAYEVDIIDTWAMTITPATITPPIVPHPIRHLGRVVGGKPDAAFGVELPGKPGLPSGSGRGAEAVHVWRLRGPASGPRHRR